MTASPARRDESRLRLDTAGSDAEPGSERPIASPMLDIVFAVNMPPHAPGPGQAAISMARSPASSSSPIWCRPTASATSWIWNGFPSQ